MKHKLKVSLAVSPEGFDPEPAREEEEVCDACLVIAMRFSPGPVPDGLVCDAKIYGADYVTDTLRTITADNQFAAWLGMASHLADLEGLDPARRSFIRATMSSARLAAELVSGGPFPIATNKPPVH